MSIHKIHHFQIQERGNYISYDIIPNIHIQRSQREKHLSYSIYLRFVAEARRLSKYNLENRPRGRLDEVGRDLY